MWRECEGKNIRSHRGEEEKEEEEVRTLITFGTTYEKESLMKEKRMLLLRMVMTKMMKGRVDRALCVSSIVANVQFLTISVCLSVCLSPSNSSPTLRLPRALNWGQMSPVCACVCVCAREDRRHNISLGHYVLCIHAQSHMRRVSHTQMSSAHHAWGG